MTQDAQDAAFFRPPSAAVQRRGGVRKVLVSIVFAGLCAAALWAATLGHETVESAMITATPSLGAAEACLRAADYPCAEADFRAYVQKYPNDGRANARLAMALTEDGRHDEALPYYKRAGELGVATYDFYASYATSLDKTGHTDDAIKENYAALNLVPRLVDVRGNLADELVLKGRKAEALNLLGSFDQSLVDEGHPPYFTDQIARIKGVTENQTETAAQIQTPARAGTTEIALLSEQGTLHVPVLVNDSVALNFIVDSGASDVMVTEDVARTLMRNGTLTGADYRGMRTYMLADGTQTPSQMFILRSMKVGDHEIHNVTASISRRGGVLLLGQSFLRKFKSWSIDNRRRVLVLED
jgi:clan AA aspartic protease (TIGR02281 family)